MSEMGAHRTPGHLATGILGAIFTATSVLLMTPRPACAHGDPIPLAFWGNFGRANGRCQRHISRAAALCGVQVWAARRSCQNTEFAGDTCDDDADDDAVQAARLTAIQSVEPVCTDSQAFILQFLGLAEAQIDIIDFCRRLETAAVSAAYRPLPPADSTTVIDDTTRTCVQSAALATTKLLHRAFRSRQRALDRIAVSNLTLPEKEARLERSTQQIGRAMQQLQERITRSCPETAFESVYGISIDEFLASIAARADCLGESTYAQGGVLCPLSTCGNGMIEAGEQCDDANHADGDGCSADCARE